jgi:hypothetical protein
MKKQITKKLMVLYVCILIFTAGFFITIILDHFLPRNFTCQCNFGIGCSKPWKCGIAELMGQQVTSIIFVGGLLAPLIIVLLIFYGVMKISTNSAKPNETEMVAVKQMPKNKRVNITILLVLVLVTIGLCVSGVYWNKARDKKFREIQQIATEKYAKKPVVIPCNEYKIYEDKDIIFEYPYKVCEPDTYSKRGYHCEAGTYVIRSNEISSNKAFDLQNSDGKFIYIVSHSPGYSTVFNYIDIEFVNEEKYSGGVKELKEFNKYTEFQSEQNYPVIYGTIYGDDYKDDYGYIKNENKYIVIFTNSTGKEQFLRLINSIILK